MPKSAKLGQNFLHDRNIAAKIIDVFLPQAGPSRPALTGPVLEIGPGPGILSALLLERVPAGLVTLVELDRFLAQRLKERFGDPPRVIREDILKVDLARLYPGERVAVIGNLPYHISKPLVDWLIVQRRKIGSAVLMLQKDFIDKLLSPAGSKKYNAQSVVFQLLFQARRCFDVPAGAFTPKPKIVSTVIAARPVESPLPDGAEFYDFVKLCFAGRRKTLANNLAQRYPDAVVADLFAAFGLKRDIRAEQLPADRFPPLYAALKKYSGEEG